MTSDSEFWFFRLQAHYLGTEVITLVTNREMYINKFYALFFPDNDS